MTRHSSYRHSSIARMLTLIGAILALIGWIMQIITIVQNGISDNDLVQILYCILGIVISIFILSSLGYVSTKTFIPYEWWMLLIFVIIQALFGSINLSILGIGVILELIAAIILLVDRL